MLSLLVIALAIIAPTVFVYFLVIRRHGSLRTRTLLAALGRFLLGRDRLDRDRDRRKRARGGALTLALGAGPADPLVQASTASFVAPLVEETTKGAGLLFLWAVSAFWLRARRFFFFCRSCSQLSNPHRRVVGLSFLTRGVRAPLSGFVGAQGRTALTGPLLRLYGTRARAPEHTSFTL